MPNRVKCWALKDSQGRYVQIEHGAMPQEAFKNLTFRTQRAANEWLARNLYWYYKAKPVQVIVTIKEVGEP
jgi:hypothetical protein